MDKSADAYRTISEVAEELKLPQHVLRFWETRFPQVRPLKRGGNRRFYRPEDVELLRAIRALLYGDGYTIKGVQKILKQQGPRVVAGLSKTTPPRTASGPARGDAVESRRAYAMNEAGDADIIAEGQAPLVTERQVPMLPPPHPEPSTRSVESHEPVRPTLPPPAPSGYQSDDLAERLQAVLYDLSECDRLLTAARG